MRKGIHLFIFFISFLFSSLLIAETININTASSEVLSSSLSGIGISKAEAIIKYRDQYGPFKSIDELVYVKGIGKSIIEKNRNKISIE